MAKISKCVNGHFYDAEKSDICPYCKKVQQSKEKITSMITDPPTFGPDYRGSMDEDVTVPVFPGESGSNPNNRNIILGGAKRTADFGTDADDVRTEPWGPWGSRKKGNSYVTGWLVEVDGPLKGMDYRIDAGKNWLGKDHSMDIIIYEGDSSVSEIEHCAVVYEPKKNSFYIMPGSGSVTYLNGNILEEYREIKQGDRITVGNCTFEFIPFCREGHKWNKGEFGAEE